MKLWKIPLALLFLANALVLVAIFGQDDKLHLVFCDVGQGDATLIYKGSAQILVDGGPDSSVISCLSKNMPFWDRTIELVVLTHPEEDHFGGLVDILRRYKVTTFTGSGIDRESEGYKALKKEIETGKGMEKISLANGDRVRVGEITFDVLNPPLPAFTTKVLGATESVNEYSVVLGLKYGEFDALLTGDIEPPVTDAVAQELDGACHSPAPRPFHQVTTLGPLPWGSPSRVTRPGGESGCIEVLKVPHHGSKNGLTQTLFEATRPQLAVISVGKKNRYGHPHKEIVSMLESGRVKILRTDVDGEIEVVTDGKRWWVKDTSR